MTRVHPASGEAGEDLPRREGSGCTRAFTALRHRDFQLLVAGQVATSTAMWMEMVTRGWLVYEMTGSPFLLGLVHGLRSLPLLFLGVLGGVLADRMDRRRQLMLAQLSNMVLNLVLATLILTETVEVWHVFATALLAGCVIAFQQPARQSLVPNTVPREDLVNAVALNSVVLNLSHTLGPTLAGLLIAPIGVAGAYYFQAALFLAASLWTLQLKVGGRSTKSARPTGSVRGSLVDGFRYVWQHQTVLALLLLSLLPIVLALPYTSLLPVFAKDVYDAGPGGLGLLLGATGVGSVIGAFTVAGLGDFRGKGLFQLVAVMALGLFLMGMALVPWLWLAVLLLGLVGFAQTGYRVVNQSLLQTQTEDGYRGRVMSLYLLDRGIAPLGALLAGTLAALVGAPAALGAMGAMTFLTAVVVAAKSPRLRRIS